MTPILFGNRQSLNVVFELWDKWKKRLWATIRGIGYDCFCRSLFLKARPIHCFKQHLISLFTCWIALQNPKKH
jgi:hypothetical protein